MALKAEHWVEKATVFVTFVSKGEGGRIKKKTRRQ
jgi:hypothetical protein